MPDLKDRIASLSPEKRALFERQLAAKSSRSVESFRISSRNASSAPLSFAQQRIWFLDQLDPGSALYNIPIALQFHGDLDKDSLVRSIAEIVRRHGTLRTRFAVENDEPVQVIDDSSLFQLDFVDISSVAPADRKAKALQCVDQEAQQPFDMANGHLFRAKLLHLDAREHILLLTFHHSIADGWSYAIFLRELDALYRAFTRGERLALPDLPIQYTDYAVWEREWLQGETLEAQVRYWKERLAGAPALLEIPTDRPRPAIQTFNGARSQIEFSDELAQSIKTLSQHEGATLFMTLLAAFQVLLGRYSGQDDIVVGTPVANRRLEETEGLIGCFTNTLALRSDLTGDPSFREILTRVRESALGAYTHQDLPFEKLVDEIQPERSLSHSPLFQVMMALQNNPHMVLDVEGLQIEGLSSGEISSKFDLFLGMSENSGKLGGSLVYNTDLFDGDRMERMLSHYQTLLESIVADPDERISRLALLTESERHQLLTGWNGTKADYPRDRCIHELIEEQAARTPDAPAVSFQDRSLTYSELDIRSNQLAHYLRKQGVGAGTLVGLCVDRSLEMVVGILGILKAGGAYLPMDPSYPADRLAYMLEDSSSPVLLTTAYLEESLASYKGVRIRLDEDREAIEAEPQGLLDGDHHCGNPAYMIYTSGSTGLPKGVVVTHRNLVHSTWARHKYYKEAPSKFLLLSSFAFDSSIAGIFWTLCEGGCLVLPVRPVQEDLRGLLEEAAQKGISHYLCVPSLHDAFLEEGSDRYLDSVRVAIVAGEECTPHLVAKHHRLLPHASLFNEYGPTEGTVWASVWESQNEYDYAAIPIGRAIPNVQLYVLGRSLAPAPIGVSGELYIGGEGITPGYHNRPDLTAEKFVPDPFSEVPGSRLYRTGDLCRYLPDGNLEYMGRIDHQVKVRGFRIELGEIENALLELPSVREVAVVALGDAREQKRLAAYIVCKGEPISSSDLRTYLAGKLPEYMVPSGFVFLEALPLTPNGKLDRKALPSPEYTGAAYAEPRTPIEEGLAEIWQRLLRLERVGIHDNFFELGGHSLLATQVISRVRHTFDVDLPLRALFEAPTIAQLAGRVADLQSEGGSPIAPISRVDRSGPLPLSFAQQRLWFLDQFEPGNSVYNIPVAFHLRGSLNESALRQSLDEIVRRHEVLRTTFSVVDGEPVQVIGEPTASLRIVDLQSLPEGSRDAEASRLVLEEARAPFDLKTGPLFRTVVVKLSVDEHVLLLTLHHTVTDGWSQSLLAGELRMLYRAYSLGEPSPLADLSLQYADYASWQRGWLSGPTLNTQLDYWRSHLLDAPSHLELPTDRPRPSVQTFHGSRCRVVLPPSLASDLRGLCQSEGATLFMVLLAAFDVLLSRYSGQDNVVVGTPIANRTHTETEGLIGFFINTLALRGDLSGDPSFRELLSRVKAAALGAYAHQDLPFEKLVEELSPERSLSHSPIFQAMLTLQNNPREALDFEGLQVERIQSEKVSVKFDLQLTAAEGSEELALSLAYNTDLFDADRIERMLGHFETLLSGIVSNPSERISRLPLLSDAERHRVLVDWNATDQTFADVPSVHSLFEEWALRTPDAPALVFEDQSLSYRELDARANQLAHSLKKRGVGPDVLVGLCLERSLEMIVGLLGILKAGGAYVALDPTLPSSRLSGMLEDSGVKLVVTHSSVSSLVSGCDLVQLDTDWSEIGQESISSLPSTDLVSHAAYVIYTSGSTGKPKGVVIEHGQLLNYVQGVTSRLGLPAGSSYASVSTLSADLGNTCVYGSLCTGGVLHVISETRSMDPSGWRSYLSTHRVDCLKIVPSHLSALLGSDATQQSLPEQVLVLGGEASSWDLIDRIHGLSSSVRILNHYGPTETTVGVLTYAVSRDEDGSGVGSVTVPLGSPLANSRVYVLNSELSPVPVGVAGELYIGGAGVGRGYLGREDLTKERFLPDPFASASTARMYKTGDVVRWLEGGVLEFLGRSDDQVKVRGFRIELGEIESVLLSHVSVRSCVVLAREASSGEKRLVAYVVCEEANTGILREHLKERLPDYMAPAAFVFLDAMPLTPNGKVDRKALPEPDGTALSDDLVSPRNPVEEGLAEIWCSVLRLGQIGVHSNFFELGGHSLLATQVISRVRHTFDVDLPLRALFEAPTIAQLAGRVADLQGEGGSPIAPISRVDRSGPLPLSFAQQRLWFLDQFEPGNSVYNIPVAFHLRGSLNESALRQSLDEIVRRHEVLRTTFSVVDGEPVQVIGEPTASLRIVDLQSLPEEARNDEASRLVLEEARAPFDLKTGPLFRTVVVKLSVDEHLLLLTLHHTVTDGWSQSLLAGELRTLYRAYSLGELSPLADLSLQYADYASWQREWLSGSVLSDQVSYWTNHLSGAPALLSLPTDRPRPAVQTYGGAAQIFELSEELTQHLKIFGQREGATPFMVLLAAFDVLLSRYSGQDNVVVGTPIANRTHTETEGLIGFFINTLALRGDLSGDPSFRELLSRVKAAALGAYAHQDLPFEKLVEELSPERSLSHSPIFQAMLTLQNNPREALDFEGLQIERITNGSLSSKFDLQLGVAEGSAGLTLSLLYNPALFDADRMERMLGHFETLLSGIVSNPSERISRLPLLSDPERRQLLADWNDTQAEYPTDRCLHELFEEQVSRTPDRIALQCGQESLTYSQLDAWANQLSRRMRDHSLEMGSFVGICLERSVDMLAAMLAVMKAGCAYVPLDPAWPLDRLARVAANCDLKLAVTQSSLQDMVPASVGQKIIVDEERERISAHSATPLDLDTNPASLAYVLHTSGSTGVPKGVQISHQALVNFLYSMASKPGISPDDILVAVTTISFDIAGLELFLPLLLGARVVIAEREDTVDGSRLAELLVTSNATVMQATPATWHLLLAAGWPPTSRLKVLCGGEALPSSLAAEILQHTDCIWNMYGPTETTIWSSLCCVEDASLPITIGRPIANTQIYLLSDQLIPAPIGTAGELYIGGDGLARGYLNRPDLSAEKFVPDPFSPQPGARMYRTGDLCCYLEDGSIEYLGRLDHQVKVRGFRIELGEIESVLLEHPTVREAVVVAREEASGDKRLAAYVVSAGPSTASAGVLRDHLKSRLPEYMVPSAFVSLEAFPLTSNGKVDRKALPAPDAEVFSDAYVGPRNAIEEGVLQIWSELLLVEDQGVHSNFFELGGHSLLATRVVSRIRSTFGVELPISALFEHPTIAGLADRLSASLQAESGSVGLSAPALVRADRGGALPLSFAQQRLWFIDQLDPGSFLYNMPWAARLRGELDTDALARAFQEIVHRHEILRTTYAEQNGNGVQIVSEDFELRLDIQDVTALEGDAQWQEARRLMREEAMRPFDIKTNSSIRVQLIRLAETDHLLLLTLHHIAYDGWSRAVLFREVCALYNGYRAGKPVALGELKVQYADYAAWQRQWLTDEVLQELISYWRQQLLGAPAVIALPTDRPRGEATGYTGGSHSFDIPSATWRAFGELCVQERSTMFMVILSALNVLLYRLTGQSDLVIGTDLANRTQAETEPLIGFFLNHLVIRADLSGDPSFREVVQRVRKVALGAFAHQDLPFDKLVETLQPERSLTHAPIFQVLCVMDHSQGDAGGLDGIEAEPIAGECPTSKYDLSLFIRETTRGVRGQWVYRADLFDADHIGLISNQFSVLIQQVVDHPDLSIEDIELPSADRKTNGTQTSGPAVGGLRGARRRAQALPTDSKEGF